MNKRVGKVELATQKRVIKLLQKLDYQYLGDWQEEVRTQMLGGA